MAAGSSTCWMAKSNPQENSDYIFMRYSKYIFLLFFILTGHDSFSQSADSVYTLQHCIDIAIKNNLDVRKSALQLETDKIYWQQARENLIPEISSNISRTINNGRSLDPTTYNYVTQQITYDSYNLNSSVILFNGLSLQNTIKQTSLAYQAGKMDFQQAKDNITLNVITTYLQELDNEDQLTQAQNQLEVSRQQVSRLDILNKEGNVTPSQLYDLKGQLANDRLSVLTARTAIDASKLNLLAIMNVPYDKNVRLRRLTADQLPGIYKETSEQIYNKALSDLPQVKAAELRLASTKKEVSVAKGNLLPTLALSGGVTTNYSSYSNISYGSQFSNNYGTAFGIGLQIPILGNFKRRNQVALAKIDMLNAKYVDESTKIQLKQSIEQAYINMTSAYERYQILQEQVDAYAESFRTAEVRFNDGVLTSVDFVVAKGNLDRAKTNLISARYDYFIRTKILDYYQGRLSF